MKKSNLELTYNINSILNNNRALIYENAISMIKKNHNADTILDVEIFRSNIDSDEHIFVLPKENFVSLLQECINYFEKIEEYEKCQECIKLINDICKK